MGVRPARRGVAAARPDRARHGAGRTVRRRTRRAPRLRRPGARLADARRRGGGTAPRQAAALGARRGGVLHRPFRIGKVDPSQGPARRAARTWRPDRVTARRRPRATAAFFRSHVLAGGPRSQHPAHRVRGDRGRAARRDRDLRADRTVRGGARRGARDGDRGGRLHAGARGDAARGVRGARPQGPVREGASRDHRLVHRDFRPLRGAGRRGPGGRHLGGFQAGRGRGGARTPHPRRLAVIRRGFVAVSAESAR